MNDRFQHILKLALHPTTGDGEAVAALNAARRMVHKDGLDNLLNESPVVQERIVYKDKIVYRNTSSFDPYNQNSLTGDLTINARRLHDCLQTMFRLAKQRDIVFFIKSMTTSDNTIRGSSKIKWEIYGPQNELRDWFDDVSRMINALSQKDEQETVNKTSRQSKPAAKEPKRGFFAKLFGFK